MRYSYFHCLLTFLFCLIIYSSCSPVEEKQSVTKAEEEAKPISPVDTISLVRSDINKEAVATFSKRTDNPLNEWYFKVNIYETPSTFKYLMRMQFEEIRGDDTLKIPNLGIEPKPVIKPGKEQYSCIVGFLDKDGNFREYKKVYVKNNSLKVTTIRHYSVRSY